MATPDNLSEGTQSIALFVSSAKLDQWIPDAKDLMSALKESGALEVSMECAAAPSGGWNVVIWAPKDWVPPEFLIAAGTQVAWQDGKA